MKEGHSNSAACRILGIHKNTGRRWLHGRNGVEGLMQQGLDPRPGKAVPAATVSSRYLSEASISRQPPISLPAAVLRWRKRCRAR
ncbi:helix-turn-helix domain-containing protein [Burkholderia sp. LFS038]|uniref:helix-turn-helix domain-containing protein n=1 Tax=Burkholderia sp. LFS038 TaxID=3229884 RepID=UPI003A808651